MNCDGVLARQCYLPQVSTWGGDPAFFKLFKNETVEPIQPGSRETFYTFLYLAFRWSPRESELLHQFRPSFQVTGHLPIIQIQVCLKQQDNSHPLPRKLLLMARLFTRWATPSGMFCPTSRFLHLRSNLKTQFKKLILLVRSRPLIHYRIGLHSSTTTRYTFRPKCSLGQSTLALVPNGVTRLT